MDEAATTAIASVTLFGTAALLVLPLLVRWLGLEATPAGVWVGASVHEVGQVVAAGGLISPEALDVAVVAKLGRVVLLAPLIAVVGALEARRAARLSGQAGTAVRPGGPDLPAIAAARRSCPGSSLALWSACSCGPSARERAGGLV